MEAFLEWANQTGDIDPVLRAAKAHLWFVTIHPFDDGNGRIARALADMARRLGLTERIHCVASGAATGGSRMPATSLPS